MDHGPWTEQLLGQGLAIIDYHLPSVGSIWSPSVRTLGEENGCVCGQCPPCTRTPYNHQSSSKLISQMPCIINETAEHASDAAQQ